MLNSSIPASAFESGVLALVEGANMPTTRDAVDRFRETGVLFGPGKAANAGGVATSALEMQQNASRESWSLEHTEARLQEIMANIHTLCTESAKDVSRPHGYVTGANVAGFVKVADAMIAQGII